MQWQLYGRQVIHEISKFFIMIFVYPKDINKFAKMFGKYKDFELKSILS